MTAKRLHFSKSAQRDVERAIDYLVHERALNAAEAFVGSLERSYAHIASHPSAGSPRYANQLNIPGLRSWRVKGFTYIVFYVERLDQIDVIHVLHAQQDIPAWIGDVDDC